MAFDDKKDPFKTAPNAAQDVEPGLEDQSSAGVMEEIRRSMGSRHINMIAIAGMIVGVHPSKCAGLHQEATVGH